MNINGMKVILITFLLLLSAIASPNSLTIKYYRIYKFQEEKKEIQNKVEVSQKELPYMKSFWRVFYDSNNRVIGEEYFKNWRLHYFYIYHYNKNEIHKRGFYWHGITDRSYFRIQRKYIWQGYYYKREADVWYIYDNHSGRLTVKAHYHPYNRKKIDYTDRYYYENDRLVRIQRYRRGILTKTYFIK